MSKLILVEQGRTFKTINAEELACSVHAQSKVENVIIDYSSQCASVNGKEMNLTRLEFNLLAYLVERKNMAVNRRELLMKIWGMDYIVETRATDDTIKRLRKKLKQHQADIQISTIRGFGFIIKNSDPF